MVEEWMQAFKERVLLYLRRFLFFLPWPNVKLRGTYLRYLHSKFGPRQWRRVLHRCRLYLKLGIA